MPQIVNRFIFLFAAILICSISCEEEKRTIMSPEEKKVVDSLYTKRVSYVRQEMDSLCDVLYEDIYNTSVDSIMTRYIEEIKIILEGEGS